MHASGASMGALASMLQARLRCDIGETHTPMHEDAYDATSGVEHYLASISNPGSETALAARSGRLEGRAGLSDQDREDIAALARRGMVTACALRRRAEESMAGNIGDLDRLRNSIQI